MRAESSNIPLLDLLERIYVLLKLWYLTLNINIYWTAHNSKLIAIEHYYSCIELDFITYIGRVKIMLAIWKFQVRFIYY